MLIDLESCPLCASGDFLSLGEYPDALAAQLSRGDADEFVGLTNSLCRCRACGVAFLNPRLDEAALKRLYSSWYGDEFARSWQDPEFRGRRLAGIERNYLRHLRRWASPPGSLLDVGCGTGELIEVAAAHGWSSEGLEWDAIAADNARRLSGRPVTVAPLADAGLAPGSFDVVTMFDYLEHSMAPGSDLDQAKSLLRPGGILVVRVPNIGGWVARLTGPRWAYLISNHLTLYTIPVLSRALADRGYEVLSCSARGHRGVAEVIRDRWRWLRARLPGLAGPKRAVRDAPRDGATGGRGYRAVLRAIWLEQLDLLAGPFNGADLLTIVARRRSGERIS